MTLKKQRHFSRFLCALFVAAFAPLSARALPSDCDVIVKGEHNFSDFQRTLNSTGDLNNDRINKICLDANTQIVNTSEQQLTITRDDIQIYADLLSNTLISNKRTDGSQKEQSVFEVAPYVDGVRFTQLTIESNGPVGDGIRVWTGAVVEEINGGVIRTNGSGQSAALSGINVSLGQVKKVRSVGFSQKPGAGVKGIFVANSRIDSIESVFFNSSSDASYKYNRVAALSVNDASVGNIDGFYFEGRNPSDSGIGLYSGHVANISHVSVNTPGFGLALNAHSSVGTVSYSSIKSSTAVPIVLFSSKIGLIDEVTLNCMGDNQACLNIDDSSVQGIRLLQITSAGETHPLGGNGIVAFKNSKVAWILNYQYAGKGKSIWADSSSRVANPASCPDVTAVETLGSGGCEPPVGCDGPGYIKGPCSCAYVGCGKVSCPRGAILDTAKCLCVLSPPTPQPSPGMR